MHAAAFRALGLPHAYEKLETSEADLPSRIEALRDGTYAGLNVTLPHKSRVLDLVDAVDPGARAIGAANTLVRTTHGILAMNTDAPALGEELARLAPDLRHRSAIVLGTGGVARSAIVALAALGARAIVVRGRREVPGLAALAGAGVVRFEPLVAPASEEEDVGAIVQATTAGMTGSGDPGHDVAGAIAWHSVPADAAIYDVVYAPPSTPILAQAAALGLAHACGIGMLVAQGALAFQAWLGVAPPRDVMRKAIG